MNKANDLTKHIEPCPDDEHEWEKEYHFGAQTGDMVCRKCGISDFQVERQKKQTAEDCDTK